MKKIILAVATAVALMLALASPAQASSTSNVWNSSLSVSNVYVYKTDATGIQLRPGTNTTMYVGWNYVTWFFVIPSGCRAASQYSPSGSYPYGPSTRYYTNGINLSLRTVCYY